MVFSIMVNIYFGIVFELNHWRSTNREFEYTTSDADSDSSSGEVERFQRSEEKLRRQLTAKVAEIEKVKTGSVHHKHWCSCEYHLV